MTSGRRPLVAFAFAVPIAVLGGLIGLGGAEFRLPVLVGPLRFAARVAVPLNLAVSLATVGAALAGRGALLRSTPLDAVAMPVVGLLLGAVVTAWLGPGLAARLSEERFEALVGILLVAIGLALIVEAFLPGSIGPLVPEEPPLRFGVAVVLGLAIGLVSSLLGVAGGELLIPTLVFGFGVDIRLAGTASLLVSLPVIVVGIARYRAAGAYRERAPLVDTVAPMAVGSVIGAVVGAALVSFAPTPLLKAVLGIVLIASAVRFFRAHPSPVAVT